MSFVGNVIAALLIFAAVALGAIILNQHKLVYIPELDGPNKSPGANPTGWQTPADRQMPYENVYLTARDGNKIHMWLIKQADSTHAPTLIFFHGNAGNIGHRLPNYDGLYKHVQCNIVCFSYRGYGNSEGTPSEKQWFEDLDDLMKMLLARDDLNPKNFFVFGRSLGGAVAIQMCKRHSENIQGVILENTFWNIAELASMILPIIKPVTHLIGPFIRDRYESCLTIREFPTPSLFLSGDDDMLVPPSHMHRLFEQSTSTFKKFVNICGGTHNDSWSLYPLDYYATIVKFMAEANSGAKGVVRESIGVPVLNKPKTKHVGLLQSIMKNELTM